jgi:2-amino-4-hydroxy-6-hydroxymethyldihydropteridine diphosphokinase
MGSREPFIRTAIAEMDRIPSTRVLRVSSLYDSEAMGTTEPQPNYLNAAALLETELPPRRLLWHLLLIEARLGRERHRRYGPRPIDLDLLTYDSRVLEENDLVIPHPRMLERPFVLVPLGEIDPDFVHPVAKRSIKELIKGRHFSAAVRWSGRLWS